MKKILSLLVLFLAAAANGQTLFPNHIQSKSSNNVDMRFGWFVHDTAGDTFPRTGTNYGWYNHTSDLLILWTEEGDNDIHMVDDLFVPLMDGNGTVVVNTGAAGNGKLQTTNSISVSNLNVATLIVTNGIPAAGSNFDIQYNFGGILTASDNFNIIPSAFKITVANPGTAGEIDIQGEGFIKQANAGVALAFGTLENTNLMINPLGAVIVRPSPGTATNLFQVENTNYVPVVYVTSNGVQHVESNIRFGIVRPAITVSNIILSLRTNTYEFIGGTNLVLTFVTNVLDGASSDTKLYIRPNGNINLIYERFNTATNGYYWHTNANAPMWTTATNGHQYVIALSSIGTNLFSTITEW